MPRKYIKGSEEDRRRGREQQRKWRERHPEKARRYSASLPLKRKYGIDID